MNLTATYSPEDNKLRLYADAKLPRDLYDRVKAAGFIWAPKQELFVAPAWSPDREDLLLELCGEIGDEDTSLVERAEDRADRFGDYSERRAGEAHRAKEAVASVADNIPLGQPILVGHHSERRARKDAEKIENGMRRAVKLWRTSQYWLDRAKGALSHAKYKELPAVRHRRIKTLEADKRKHEREKADLERGLRFWRGEMKRKDGSPLEVTAETAKAFCNGLDHSGLRLPSGEVAWSAWSALDRGEVTHEYVRDRRLEGLPARVELQDRWIAHLENRLAYERAMLDEQGGIKAARFDLQPGGQVLAEGLWLTITKLNKKGGEVLSVSTNNRSWPRVVAVEIIKDYRPPAEGDAEQVKAALKAPPLCNYPGVVSVGRFQHGNADAPPAEAVPITQAEWDRTHKDYKGTRVVNATETAGRHRVRTMIKGYKLVLVFITDARRKDPPAPDGAPAPKLPPVRRDVTTAEREAKRAEAFRAEVAAGEADPFAKLADALKEGVKIVSAPQLFPTPPDLAARVVGLADIRHGMSVLEPSAGTGALLDALLYAEGATFGLPGQGSLACVEINAALADALRGRFAAADVRRADFLCLTAADLGPFDRVVMNPPFADAADIRHVEHARRFLKPGGRLVAIMANGPRQQAWFRALMDSADAPACGAWHDLPPDSFKESGTSANAAIVVIDA